MAKRPRVLLVDDDVSIRRFVAMAIEELGVELLACASVAEALATLREQGPVELVLTDLMMPGESGLVLLQRLADEPALRGSARLAVFSAGLQGVVQRQLASYGIWRQLAKPVSVTELEDCVREAVLAASASVGTGRKTGAAAAEDAATDLTAEEISAVQTHFAGERDLFITFRDSCLLQFSVDVRQGDAAVAQGDAPALRRLAHSLKSVLATLGHEAPADVARQLEFNAAAGDWAACRALWNALRAGLGGLIARRSTTP